MQFEICVWNLAEFEAYLMLPSSCFFPKVWNCRYWLRSSKNVPRGLVINELLVLRKYYSKKLFQLSLKKECHWSKQQGPRNSGRALRGGSEKVKGNANLWKTKQSLPIMLVSVQQRLWPQKIIPEIIENQSEVSGCTISCNKFVSSQFWSTMKLPMILL